MAPVSGSMFDTRNNSIPDTDGCSIQTDRLQTVCQPCQPTNEQCQTTNGYVVTSPSDACGSITTLSDINQNLLTRFRYKQPLLEFHELWQELRHIEDNSSLRVPIKRSKRCVADDDNNLEALQGLTEKIQPLLNGHSTMKKVDNLLVQMIKIIFAMKAEQSLIFMQDNDGDTKLHLVIIFDMETVALEMIDSMTDYSLLNIQNQLRQTPLHLAVLLNMLKVVRRLMSCGVEIDASDHTGNTPLHIACRDNNTKMAEVLLTPIKRDEILGNKCDIQYRQIPQDLNIRNFDGETCLDIAFKKGNNELLELLLDKGANVDQRCLKTGRTLLYRACSKGDLKLVKNLIEKRHSNVNARAYDGTTPFDSARSSEQWHIAAILAQRGAESDSDLDID